MKTYVTSLKTRLTRSARGELYNPLIYPFIFTTFAYGVGLTFFSSVSVTEESSLFTAMNSIGHYVPVIWGSLALLVVAVGFYVLVFDKPPVGKANCLLAWMLWLAAALVYIETGAYLALFAVAVPSLFFWTWQYFSLTEFRRQDELDAATMRGYDRGQYDDGNGGRQLRLDNRGVDEVDRSE